MKCSILQQHFGMATLYLLSLKVSNNMYLGKPFNPL